MTLTSHNGAHTLTHSHARTPTTAKDLDEAYFADWASRYKAACAAATHRSEKVAAMCEELETGLTLLGATAVEDKLQASV
jgi:magnesium-transporting ATPase (P-type)